MDGILHIDDAIFGYDRRMESSIETDNKGNYQKKRYLALYQPINTISLQLLCTALNNSMNLGAA